MAHPPIPIVLQTGASGGIARIFAVAFAFASVGAGGLLVLLIGADTLPVLERSVLPLVPVGFFWVSVFAHRAVWLSRATDLVWGSEGLRLQGGPSGGLEVAWSTVNPDATRIDTNENVTVTINGQVTPQRTLVLATRDGVTREIARSTDPGEQLSFVALLGSVREAARGAVRAEQTPPDGGAADEGPASVLRCLGCGAPVSPADQAMVQCWRCERDVCVPKAVREKLQVELEGRVAQATVEVVVARALQQPSARRANGWLLGSVLAPYLVPVLLCGDSARWVSWIALAFLVVALSDLQVARRAALPRLGVVYAARPPLSPGAPLRCRSCAGPLPDSEALVVTCPWCDAANIRALQLERPAALWRDAAGDLLGFLVAQADRERWPRLMVRFWGLVAVGGLLSPWIPWERLGE